MKFLIAISAIILNLTALEFKKDVSVIGMWYIRGFNDASFQFLGGVGNQWSVEFKEDGSIYEINKNGSNNKRPLKWKYDKNGIINVEFQNAATQNDIIKEITDFRFRDIFNEDFKIIKQVDIMQNRNCYLIEVINKSAQAYMCEILNKEERQKREKERAKKAVSIQIK